MTDTAPWWREAVVYEVYVRSFADSGSTPDSAGIGDLAGIAARLPYLRDLGVDAVWLTPFYPSPQHDAGYDVADYRDVDPLFGSLAAAQELLDTAHDLGLKVVVDLVPNHTSSEHVWFQQAVAAAPGSPERARYLFRDGEGPGGDEPPNNWQSVFGGSAWTRLPPGPDGPGQWYLHLFDTSQPDLDWRNPEVGDDFERTLRFWLDRGVDGFRVDVAHGLVKEASLRDQRGELTSAGASDPDQHSMVRRTLRDEPMWDQPEVHDIYRRWHQVLADYPGDRMAVAEAWTQTPESMAQFVRPDELHQSFNFAWLLAPWSAAAFADVVTGTFAALAHVAAAPTWVLSNHDVARHVTRYGGGPVGLARARAATLTMLALPGSAYLYQGEELGLEEVDVPADARQDPAWLRDPDPAGPPGRDGCRVPLPWSGGAPPYGFTDGTAQPWLPQPTDWAPLTVTVQEGEGDSTLSFYRRALIARRQHALGGAATVELVDAGPDVLSFTRDALTVVLNCGTSPVDLPAGDIVVASGPLDGRTLPPDTAAWLG